MLDFLGIGAQKAGTTWLFEKLQDHPRIHMPNRKELHFWNRGSNLQRYLSNFPDSEGVRQGEITPAYATLSVDTIRKIYDLNPDLRLIYILRNPIQRAWSAALMALQRAQMTADEASDAWFLDVLHSRASLDRGDYEGTIRRWTTVFPTEQFLILFLDDIQTDPREVLVRCAHHLDVEAAPYQIYPEVRLRKRVFSTGGPSLRPGLAMELKALYGPRIESLSVYLGRDLNHWLWEP